MDRADRFGLRPLPNSLSFCRTISAGYRFPNTIAGQRDDGKPPRREHSFLPVLSCITPVSLLVKIDPNLGDHMQIRNAENANKTGHKKTRLNLREKLHQDCKNLYSSVRFRSFQSFQNIYRDPLIAKKLILVGTK